MAVATSSKHHRMADRSLPICRLHRIRAWYREQRILERYKNEQRASRAIDPFAEAMLLMEAEDIMVAAIGARRYALLRAYRYDGVPVKELAEQRIAEFTGALRKYIL